MANYQSANFNLYFQPFAVGPKIWVYDDTGPVADVVAAGFVTNGAEKGCDSGDLVIYKDTSRDIVYGLKVSSITDTGATQVTLDGQVILADTS